MAKESDENFDDSEWSKNSENDEIKNEESTSWEETDLFKNRFAESTPGEMIFTSRDILHWKQN